MLPFKLIRLYFMVFCSTLFMMTPLSTLFSFTNKSTPCRNEWVFILFLTTVLTFFLHGHALNGFWRFDDGAHLMFATEYSPWQYFFDPAITRLQSGANVTPWNVFFYDINLFLFGFNPMGFYAHLLLVLFATALALFSLLRFWFSLPVASLGLLLFLLGKPTNHMAQELMCNHYLTGMLFSLLSLNFFVSYVRSGNYLKIIVATALYALAVSCKEVYAPLIAFPLFLPVGDIKQRFFSALPFLGVAMGYIFWRHAVLGVWLGGYNPAAGQVNVQDIVQQLANIPILLFDKQGDGLVGLVILTVISIVAFWNRSINGSLFLVALIAVFLPLIPLTLSPGVSQADRYLFVPWVATSIWSAVIFQRINKSTISVKSLAALVLVVMSFFGYTHEVESFDETIKKAERIYHFSLEANFSDKVLMLDLIDSDYWAYVTSEARQAYDISRNLSPTQPPIVVNALNGLLLLEQIAQNSQMDLSATQFYLYRNGFEVVEIKPIIHSLLKALKRGKNKPLKITLQHQKGVLLWRFQPKYLSYSAIVWKGKDKSRYPILKLPEQGSYPWSKKDDMLISIAYQNDGNWSAISPKLSFDPIQKELSWEGESDIKGVTKKLKALLVRLE